MLTFFASTSGFTLTMLCCAVLQGLLRGAMPTSYAPSCASDPPH
jgi:hypothetical protein